MRTLPIILLLASCSPPTPNNLPALPAKAQCAAKPFHYPWGDLANAKMPGSPLPYRPIFSTGGQGTTCGASIGLEQEAIDAINDFCSCAPPDGSIAVGSGDVVVAVNTAYQVWNTSGTSLAGPSNLATLLTPSGDTLTNFTDPFVLYDGTATRWVMGMTNYNNAETSSTLNVVVSTSSDPTSTWTLYTFAMPTGDFLDFPHAAISGASGSEVLYVTGNLFAGPTTFKNAYAIALNLTNMYAGTTPTPVTINVGNNASGVTADTLIPAQNVGSTSAMYYLSTDNQKLGNSRVSVFKWSDPLGTNTWALQGGVTVASYIQPPKPWLASSVVEEQVDTNDARELTTYYYSGTLYGAHSVGVTTGSSAVAAAQWYQIGSIDTTPTLTQQGTNATSDAYRWMPSLAIDSSGNMVMSYAYTIGGPIGTRFTARYSGTTSGALLGETDLVDGTAAGLTNVDPSRWGDFGTTVFDGTNFWTVAEYMNGSPTNAWSTYLASISLGTTANFDIAVTPTFQDVLTSHSGTYTVSADACNGYSGTINLSASNLPLHATAGFSPTSITGSTTSTLTFTAASNTPVGMYTLDITGTDSGGSPIDSSVEAVANVLASDYTISASPTSATVARGGNTKITVTFGSLSGYTGTNTPVTTGQPAGSGSWKNYPITVGTHGASTTFTVNVGSSDPTGVYPMEIIGVDTNGLEHRVLVTLTVT